MIDLLMEQDIYDTREGFNPNKKFRQQIFVTKSMKSLEVQRYQMSFAVIERREPTFQPHKNWEFRMDK